jgi:hypothetical protein
MPEVAVRDGDPRGTSPSVQALPRERAELQPLPPVTPPQPMTNQLYFANCRCVQIARSVRVPGPVAQRASLMAVGAHNQGHAPTQTGCITTDPCTSHPLPSQIVFPLLTCHCHAIDRLEACGNLCPTPPAKPVPQRKISLTTQQWS